jgi:hypothetical protein
MDTNRHLPTPETPSAPPMPHHLQVLHELLSIEIDLTRLMQK